MSYAFAHSGFGHLEMGRGEGSCSGLARLVWPQTPVWRHLSPIPIPVPREDPGMFVAGLKHSASVAAVLALLITDAPILPPLSTLLRCNSHAVPLALESAQFSAL